MGYRITLHARHKARELGLTIAQVREMVDLEDICETILVVNPADSLHTVTTVYEVNRKEFPDGRTRRRTP